MTRLAYIAHPVGQGEARAQNLVNVNSWFLALFKACPDLAFSVPWKIYVDNLSEDHRTRAMRDDLENLSRCDILFLTGGKITPGMGTELMTARVENLIVIDLTDLGYEAPSTPEALKELADRIARLIL